ncbi:MAG TPA: MTH895/ArsE family thioredoxin-like protein [Thermoanaerobaculaceae bacterium]|nr:MTH895/ArsE family thioredoxin-like protein [Thermoanaerobaculaceae bacterium]HRS16421.1 MTH895/ArsE family thioredoxin-like protein [Thermoanaerobaculaceae bacterium]
MNNAPKTIEVLGPGCPRCKETYRVVRHVVESAGLACEVIKNESIDRMVELGVMATPVVVVDGKVVLLGRIPKAHEVEKLLGI